MIGLMMTEAEIKRLKRLIPEANCAFVNLCDWLRKDGIELFVGSCFRDPGEQLALYKAGKSANQLSWHNLGRGIDAYPKLPDGSPDLNGKNVAAFKQMQMIAPRFGLTGVSFNPDGTRRYIQVRDTNGKLKRISDLGHLEFRAPYVSLKDALKSELHLHESAKP